MRKALVTEININALPQKVWEVLMDFKAYPEWNPFIIAISGEPKVGSTLKTTAQPKGGQSMSFKPTVLVCDEHQEFRWKGKFLIPGLFDGEHYFLLQPNDDGSTTFVHGEIFNGLLVGLFGQVLTKTEEGFKLMNEAMKERCE